MPEPGWRILVVGQGGREHALVQSLAASPHVTTVYCAPGNPGTAQCATNVPIGAEDLDRLVDWAIAKDVDFVVVGPEAPLVAGLVDHLEAAGIPAFGPTMAGARLEASKAYAKTLMAKACIPTAPFRVVSTLADAITAIDALIGPTGIVIKADGLAAGKGVIVADTREEALIAAETMLSGRFGDAGRTLVIEARLSGPEASLIAIVDGTHYRAFPLVRDHKRLHDGDAGPNTGGMGVVTLSDVPASEQAALAEHILTPLLTTLREAGITYCGVIFAGLLKSETGWQVLEFNCRFGDPEAQVLLGAMQGDLAVLLDAAIRGRLATVPFVVDDRTRVCVVAAAPGYPEQPRKGTIIRHLPATDGVQLFHAGTGYDPAGDLIVTGGRVLNIVAEAPDLNQARQKVYDALAPIRFGDALPHYRTDIGLPGGRAE